MVNAVELVRQRLLRAAAALKAHNVNYAVIGGNAVAAWVATVDETAVRNTQDVDILLRRSDLPAARSAFEAAGFVRHNVMGVDLFLDGPTSKPGQAVHVVFANEVVKPGEPATNPDVTDFKDMGAFRVLSLEAIVRLQLSSMTPESGMLLRDMIGVGLVDHSWNAKLPPILAARLQMLLDTPDG